MDFALVNEVSPRLVDCALTYKDRVVIDIAEARRQHDEYVSQLEQGGLTVRRLEINQDYPDSVFVEDTAVVVDETAVMTPMGAESRRGEVEAMAEVLAEYRPVVRIRPPAKLEGGDVLRVGRRVFVGQGSRTDRAGFQALAEALGPHGYEVTPVTLYRILHLKSAVTALDDETLIVSRDAIDIAPLAGFRLIDVPADEPDAANVLRLPRGLCLHAGFRRTIDLLDGLGYALFPVDISELIKAESGVTCSSIIFKVP